MTGIDRDGLVNLTSELVGAASENPPGDEAEVAEVLVDRLEMSPIAFAIDVREVAPDRPNVIARAGDPDNGSVLLTGHTDVVPADPDRWSGDPYTVREEDGRLVGRGVADMKGALAAMLVAAEAYLRTTDDPGEVVLAFVVDEEHAGAGTAALVDRSIGVDAAIVGEPSRLEVCVAQKGVVRYRIRLAGTSAHAGTPDEGADAIRAAGRVLSRLADLDAAVRAESSHPLLAPETVTATEVDGGIAPNVVADEATIVVDWRLHPGAGPPAAYDDRLAETLERAALPAGVTTATDRTVFARPAAIDADHRLPAALLRAAEEAGVDSAPAGLNAVTDARLLLHDADVPTAVFGPGSIEDDAHTVDESVAIGDLTAAARVYRRALAELLD